jgi:NADH-quinone oxidoreductase subunit M
LKASPPSFITLIVSLILLGLLVKMAIFPLHNWLPDAHAEAPTPISALLSPAMIGIGGYAAIRIMYTAFPTVMDDSRFTTVLLGLAVTTMFYGGLNALAQKDLKRLLAFSSISQMGYLLLGAASASTLGLTGAGLLYLSHGLAKAVLFMVSGVFMHSFHTRLIDDLGGLAGKMPYTATATLIAFLSLAGVPPLLGFWGEIFMFAGSMKTALTSILTPDMTRVWLTSLAVISSIVTAGYGLWAFRRIFFGELKPGLRIEGSEAPALMLAPILTLAFITVLLGIYPTAISQAMSQLFSNLKIPP